MNAPGWYRSFLDNVIIEHPRFFAVLIIIGELAVGVTLAATALLWIFRWTALPRAAHAWMLRAIILSCAVAIMLNLAFYLASGDPLPFTLPKEPFDEGVGLDELMPLIELVIGGMALWTYSLIGRSED